MHCSLGIRPDFCEVFAAVFAVTGSKSVVASLQRALLFTGCDVIGNSKRVFGLACSCAEAKRRVVAMSFLGFPFCLACSNQDAASRRRMLKKEY